MIPKTPRHTLNCWRTTIRNMDLAAHAGDPRYNFQDQMRRGGHLFHAMLHAEFERTVRYGRQRIIVHELEAAGHHDSLPDADVRSIAVTICDAFREHETFQALDDEHLDDVMNFFCADVFRAFRHLPDDIIFLLAGTMEQACTWAIHILMKEGGWMNRLLSAAQRIADTPHDQNLLEETAQQLAQDWLENIEASVRDSARARVRFTNFVLETVIPIQHPDMNPCRNAIRVLFQRIFDVLHYERPAEHPTD